LLHICIFVLFFRMKYKINWDALGIGASLACAIHCAILPLFTSMLPVFGVNLIDNHVFEYMMIGLALVVGLYSLNHGYRKHHHHILPILLFIVGMMLLIAKQLVVSLHIWLLLPAVLLIVLAHWLNYRFCRHHNHAHQDDCNH
jgi:hypothetical protein